jgi:hypothetical protein
MAKRTKRTAPEAAPADMLSPVEAHAAGLHRYNPEAGCPDCLSAPAEDAATILDAQDAHQDAPEAAPVPEAASAVPAHQEAASVHQEATPVPAPAPARPGLLTVPCASYPRYPTLAEAPTCGTCGTAISSLRPVARADAPDGPYYHRLCATAPASGWQPTPEAASYAASLPAGSILPPGAPAGWPVCWGCKVGWKAASRAVVGTDGQVYHRLCAEWAAKLPLVSAPRAPRAPRPASPAPAAPAALVAELTVRLAGQPEALASALAALREAGILPAAPAPEAAPAPDGEAPAA